MADIVDNVDKNDSRQRMQAKS